MKSVNLACAECCAWADYVELLHDEVKRLRAELDDVNAVRAVQAHEISRLRLKSAELTIDLEIVKSLLLRGGVA